MKLKKDSASVVFLVKTEARDYTPKTFQFFFLFKMSTKIGNFLQKEELFTLVKSTYVNR